MRYLFRLYLLAFTPFLMCEEGNFAVPSITQITPLVSFGQLLVGKNALLTEFTGSYIKGPQSYSNQMQPNAIYGILDELSLTLIVPFTPNSSYCSGLQGVTLQLEYGFYSNSSPERNLQATVVTNAQIPAGHCKIDAFTGFIGTTFSYLSANWYAFVSPGANITKNSSNNSYLYQCGFARYIAPLSPAGYVFNFLVEFDGIYSPSSGNLFLVTPSLWLSSSRWILQTGVGVPITQHPTTNWYSIDYNLAFAFQF